MKVLLANPRGFCAGVDRAIQIVEKSLERYGAPIYVRHEIVHNKHVVDSLRAKGAIFIDELDDIPSKDKDRPVIFSAHGVPKSVPASAEAQNIFYIDATCPLVSKVHREAERHHKNGHHIILIGHAGHPEVIGTMGQLPEGAVDLIETVEEAENYMPPAGFEDKLSFATQTTLSVDDTSDIIQVLQRRFPSIQAPHKEDICYATTNRQNAVKELAQRCNKVMVVGSTNSSNSKRLVEVALRYGAEQAWLVENKNAIPWVHLEKSDIVGISAGASAPEILVEGVLESLKERYNCSFETLSVTQEDVVFKLPRVLRAQKQDKKQAS